MDLSDPDLFFYPDGVCNHCHEYAVKEKKRKIEATNLPWIYETIRKAGKGKDYDCLLGLSGGVDSSLALHYLAENGIRPLCFSVDNGWNNSEADENIMRMVEKLKVRFIRYTIDIPKFRELQEVFIRSGTANIEIPTDHILMATTYEMAKEYKIKWIISGGNLATEGIMPRGWGYQAKDLHFIKSIYKKFTHKKLKGLPTLSLWEYLVQRFLKGVRIVNLLDYYEYNRDQAKQLLKENYGWQDYGEKHSESKFTQWFQHYFLPTLFGIDKRKAHYSSMINSGQMTRQQALDELAKPLYYENLINLEGIFKRRSYKDYPNHEWLWNLLSKVYATFKR